METFGLAKADLHDLESLLHGTLPDSQNRAERFASLRKDIAVLGDEGSTSSVAFTKLRVADGGERHFERRIARLDDYILLTLLDVSDRVLALQALEQEMRFTESLIASMPGIFYAFDEKGQLIRWNETFKQISGDVQVQGGLSPLVAPEDRTALVAAERSAMEKGYAEVEVRIKSGPEPAAPDLWHALTLVP